MKIAAIYARVSSEKQKEENTIASQTAALVAFARDQEYSVPDEWVFEDRGWRHYSLDPRTPTQRARRVGVRGSRR